MEPLTGTGNGRHHDAQQTGSCCRMLALRVSRSKVPYAILPSAPKPSCSARARHRRRRCFTTHPQRHTPRLLRPRLASRCSSIPPLACMSPRRIQIARAQFTRHGCSEGRSHHVQTLALAGRVQCHSGDRLCPDAASYQIASIHQNGPAPGRPRHRKRPRSVS